MHNKPTYEELEKRLEECSIALAKAEAQLQELRAEPGNTGNALLKRKGLSYPDTAAGVSAAATTFRNND